MSRRRLLQAFPDYTGAGGEDRGEPGVGEGG